MNKALVWLILLLPVNCLAQLTIAGRILNHADLRAVPNASVFLKNTTIGSKAGDDGKFTLTHLKAGKYQLIVSVVGFDMYSQDIEINNTSIVLPDIEIVSNGINLKEVKIRPDGNWRRNFQWFKDAFLGRSELAKDCKIVNPDVLSLNYDEAKHCLYASSYDFLVIENQALGYRIKYLLHDFAKDSVDNNTQRIHYDGTILFENMMGSGSIVKKWLKKREQVYQGSPMNFFRAALNDRLQDEGFRVLQYGNYYNPQRPPEKVIEAKIKQYEKLRSQGSQWSDSLAVWEKKAKLPVMLQKVLPYPLDGPEIVQPTGQYGIYGLTCDGDALHITWHKNHRFSKFIQTVHLDDTTNTEVTVLSLHAPYIFFNSNGGLINPNDKVFKGAWARRGIAELLPEDYRPDPEEDNKDNRDLISNVSAKNAGADNANIQGIVSKLQAFTDEHILEKAYLHFDKPYYAAGDTMYFKAYVTTGEQHGLSLQSGILHVDLINPGNKIERSIKLRLINGLGWGDFALPDSLLQGNYRVRAYTNWMRNDDGENIFYKNIPIGSVREIPVPESIVEQAIKTEKKADTRFLPEGGNLVAGVRSKIAFKAIDVNGMGIEVKGIVVDNEDKKVAAFSSEHLGMGSFYFEPKDGKTYKAKIAYADGTEGAVDLPVPETEGVTLSVNNDSLYKAALKVEANKTCFVHNKGKAYSLLIYSGGVATSFVCRLNEPIITLDMATSKLHTGITTVTLFSPEGLPLCERLMFVRSDGQLSLDISSNKQIYKKREKVSIKLNAANTDGTYAPGHFSVAVTDESKVPFNENYETTILTNMLVTSDLKGYMEQPNYYFTDVTNDKLKQLDLVMLTHGYRRFAWKSLLNNEYRKGAWRPETTFEISGTAKNLSGKPLPKATVSLMPMANNLLLVDTTDNNGHFSFGNLLFSDTARFMLQAVNANGKNATRLSYQHDGQGPAVVPAITPWQVGNQPMLVYLENIKKQNEADTRYGPLTGRVLKQVNIRAVKEDNNYSSSALGGPGHADQVVHRSDLHGGGNLSGLLSGMLRGVTFVGDINNKIPFLTVNMSSITKAAPMLVVVDGTMLNPDGGEGIVLDNYVNTADVETIEVLRNAGAAMYGVLGGGGVLVVTTHKAAGQDAKDMQSVGILPVTMQGFYKAREFYSPKYDAALPPGTRPDLRSTIYWNPGVLTDKHGNSFFEFYNGDGPGTYRVVVEGIDDNGNIGRQVYRYKVE
ncbi:MAG: carboxypeptidase regulatory-like domain-containing protein [Sphingobacteriales bacterium]